MVTVACVLKAGGIYTPEWVARLNAAVTRHLPIDYRFVCLSDVDVPCERIPLEHGWPGWWAKLELFRLPGPVLYLDLDTAIVGDLSDIAAQADHCEFTLLRDFYRGGDGLGSGLMGWNIDVSRIYDQFAVDPVGWQQRIRGGDQAFIEQAVNFRGVARWQDRLPGQVVSYKVHCRCGIPSNARVVCLHGAPKFGDMPADDAVRQAWERAA